MISDKENCPFSYSLFLYFFVVLYVLSNGRSIEKERLYFVTLKLKQKTNKMGVAAFSLNDYTHINFVQHFSRTPFVQSLREACRFESRTETSIKHRSFSWLFFPFSFLWEVLKIDLINNISLTLICTPNSSPFLFFLFFLSVERNLMSKCNKICVLVSRARSSLC